MFQTKTTPVNRPIHKIEKDRQECLNMRLPQTCSVTQSLNSISENKFLEMFKNPSTLIRQRKGMRRSLFRLLHAFGIVCIHKCLIFSNMQHAFFFDLNLSLPEFFSKIKTDFADLLSIGAEMGGLHPAGLIAALIVSLAAVANSELTPPYFNLAEGRKISASSTCGLDIDGPVRYSNYYMTAQILK